jgi:hypothetical protein
LTIRLTSFRSKSGDSFLEANLIQMWKKLLLVLVWQRVFYFFKHEFSLLVEKTGTINPRSW